MQRYMSEDTFDSKAGPWPAATSEEEMQRQRQAGREAQVRFRAALRARHAKFELEAGVYRVDSSFEAVDVSGLEFMAKNAEIIMEGARLTAHFRFLGCENVKITGPLTLDASPFGFSQGTIVATDLQVGKPSFVWMKLHEGYPMPVKGHRITCFKPQTGVMIAHYQDVVQSVDTQDASKIKLEFTSDFCRLYKSETEKAVEIGNLICLENSQVMRGGFEIRDTDGLEVQDVSVHCFSLLWALPLKGRVRLTRYRGCRRPRTNRLMGGGFPAFGMFGGSVLIEDCEFGHNFDDLTDIGSELGFAFKQVGPEQMYVGFTNSPPHPGKELTFYNAATLHTTGTATIVACHKNEDKAINEEFWGALKAALVLTWDCVPYLVTLDRILQISELEILDCPQARPESLTIVNSYLHDSLAAGISLKGARHIIVSGNIIQRAGYRAIGAGFDPYWWEGGVPSNVTITNNHIIDSPFNLPDKTPAVNIYVDAAPAAMTKATGTPMENILIKNNTIVNSHTAAIGVAYAKNAVVVGNRIQNPMAAGLQTAWGEIQNYENPSAILLDSVKNALVSDNQVTIRDPQLCPEVIRATEKTDRSQIRLHNNTVAFPSGQPTLVPERLFRKVSCCCDAVSFEGEWQQCDHPGCFGGKFARSRCPGSCATFSWDGCRGRIFATQASSLGTADIVLDGQPVFTADFAALPEAFAGRIADSKLLNQLSFDTGPLNGSRHQLKVVVRDRIAPGCGMGVNLEAFEFLTA